MGKQEGPEDTAVVVADIQMSIHVCAIVNRVSGTWEEGRTDNEKLRKQAKEYT